ncbi:MAG: SDR family oxidoreductase [Gemmatimonadota bacterium]
MDLGLQGKVALVAASSKGLGRAVAEELSAEGASLMLCARGADALEETAGGLRSKGARVETLAIDLTAAGAAEQVADAARNRFGQIDILITNAGGPPPGPFEAHNLETWRAAVSLLLETAVDLARQVLPEMKERRWGRIINITSIAVKQPVDNLILSNSIRAAVTGMARTLANEVAPFGITVNNVLPGYTRTERVVELAEALGKRDGITAQDVVKRWESEIPMHRMGEPKEFAACVAFLASERASFITGTSITVDGGWVKGLL